MSAGGKGKRERRFRCRLLKARMDNERGRMQVHIVPDDSLTLLFFTLPFLFMATSHSQQGDYLFL